MIIKIYGERNTGTNYLEQLLEKHISLLPKEQKEKVSLAISPKLFFSKEKLTQAEIENFGWKHRCIDKEFLHACGFERKTGLVLTLTKNPYSWLLSLHKRPYAPIHLRQQVIAWDENGYPLPHSDRNIKIIRKFRSFGWLGKLFLSAYPQWSEYEWIDFKDFIRARWFTQFNENLATPVKNPIQLWNIKNKAYIELAKHYDVLSFSYEALIESPEKVIRAIFDRLDLPLKEFSNVAAAAKKEDVASKDHEFYREYYLNERWRDRLSEKEIKWISSQLDPSIMESFGYQIL